MVRNESAIEQTIFIQLSLILAIAAGVSITLRAFRQPLIIGYILTGFIVGPALLNIIHDNGALTSFSQIGIALLLFVIGLGLDAGIIRATGKPVLVSFGFVVVGVGGVALLGGRLLGLPLGDAVVLATALLFSSTIIVITSLSNKKEQSRLYGQIAIGVLLVEDITATLALLFVAAHGSSHAGGGLAASFGLLLLKGLVLAAALVVCGLYLLPRTVQAFARSQELLFIFALAWAFGVASIFYWYGFSLEVGALFAGVSMAHLPYAREISTRLKPLRDFFIVLFFVELGQNLKLDAIGSALLPALLASLLVMVAKPLMVLLGLGMLGYTKQTGFKAAIHLSQISEFSIILVVLAVSKGIASPHITAIVTLTAVITIVVSAYLMKYDDRLYTRFQKQLSWFERKRTRREVRNLKTYPLVLLGYRGGGSDFVRTFQKMNQKYIVIDYDPEVIDLLEDRHVNHLYGDVTDLELLDEISLYDSELVVSSLADISANLLLVRHIMGHPQRGRDKDTIFVCHAATLDEASQLYQHGASYVLLPQLIGSEKASSFIRRNGSNKAAFDAYRRRHMASMGSVQSQ